MTGVNEIANVPLGLLGRCLIVMVIRIPFHDNASGWGADATAIGFSPNSTPATGAIAWWALMLQVQVHTAM